MQNNSHVNRDETVYSQTEDAALKAAAQFFGDELFPYLGIEEKPLGLR